MPYLPIDPGDVGRAYEADVIRINSQSGKGGIGYILETQFKLVLPPKMREVFGYHIKSISDRAHKELTPAEVHDVFLRDFVNLHEKLKFVGAVYEDVNADMVSAKVEMEYFGKPYTVMIEGNGRLDCVSNAIKQITGKEYVLENYSEHALEEKSTAKAASYVSILADGKTYWGVGIHSDIMTSSIRALVSAINKTLE